MTEALTDTVAYSVYRCCMTEDVWPCYEMYYDQNSGAWFVKSQLELYLLENGEDLRGDIIREYEKRKVKYLQCKLIAA